MKFKSGCGVELNRKGRSYGHPPVEVRFTTQSRQTGKAGTGDDDSRFLEVTVKLRLEQVLSDTIS